MQFVFGSYQHAADSVAFKSIRKGLSFGTNGRPHLEHWDWTIEGKLIGTNQLDINNKLAALISAYGVVNPVAAGYPGSPFYITRANTIGGIVSSVPVSHEGIYAADGVTYLKYVCGISAVMKIAFPNTVLAYTETVSFTDNMGLPKTVERTPLAGRVIKQQVSTNSWYYATQQGSMTVAFSQATHQPPLFPDKLRTTGDGARSLTYTSPELLRGEPTQTTVNWKYDYSSEEPFFSLPSVRT